MWYPPLARSHVVYVRTGIIQTNLWEADVWLICCDGKDGERVYPESRFSGKNPLPILVVSPQVVVVHAVVSKRPAGWNRHAREV